MEKLKPVIALLGTEVKSIREGRINLKDSYALVRAGEAICSTVTSAPIPMETSRTTIPFAHENSSFTTRKYAN